MDYEIELKDLPERHVATIRATTSREGMGKAFGELLSEVSSYLQECGVRPSGPSFGIFHRYAEDVEMEVGFPVDDPVEGAGRVVGRTLDAATFAVTWHRGSYQSIGDAHRAIEAWMDESGRKPTGPPWEVYWKGPGDTPDVSDYSTEVGYPIG